MTCFTPLCSRVGEFTWLITISQVVQKQILKAVTLLHKSLSNYILRGLPFPGITTVFIEAIFEQTEESWFLPSASLTTAVYATYVPAGAKPEGLQLDTAPLRFHNYLK